MGVQEEIYWVAGKNSRMSIVRAEFSNEFYLNCQKSLRKWASYGLKSSGVFWCFKKGEDNLKKK